MEVNNMENNSFVFYKSFLDTAQELGHADPNLAYKYFCAVAQYGVFGEYDESDPVINGLMIPVIMGIDRAQERYQEAKENGRGGGRPREYDNGPVAELMNQGYTAAQIAEKLNCSLRTAQRRMKEIRDNK